MKKLLILPALFVMMTISVETKAQKIYDFTSIDKTPEYPGGMKEFYNYLTKNIKYPDVAKKNKTEGKVWLSFVVETNGTLTDVTVTRGLTKETDAEALRVIKNSPKWRPGKIKGKAVRVKYNINVNFNPSGNADPTKKNSLGIKGTKNPKYPGGETKLFSYLAKNIRYPKKAVKDNVEGKVLLSFYVEPNGTISNIIVDKGLSKETDAEAIRVIKNSPKWLPGIDANGKPIRVKYNLPINFTLS